MDNESLQEYFYGLWMDLLTGIEADIRGPDSSIRAQFDQFVSRMAEELSGDAALQAVVNRWLVDSTVALVGDNQDAIASLISDTVDSWDAQETSQRVELAIGYDLQYIRINGTLVGGLVGLIIHAIKLV